MRDIIFNSEILQKACEVEFGHFNLEKNNPFCFFMHGLVAK